MTTPQSGSSRSRRSSTPLVLTVVFALIAVGAIVWQVVDRDDGSRSQAESSSCAPQSGDRSGAGDGVLKIGTIFPQTGRQLDSTSPQLVAATEMAVQDVNAAGGVPGLQLAKLDSNVEVDEGVPGSATTCESVGKLLGQRVDAVVGPSASVDSQAAYGRVTGAGTLMVSPASTLAALSSIPDRGLFFRTASTDDLQGKVLGDEIADEGNHTVAVVSSDEAYASGLSDAIVKELKTRPGITTATLSYRANDPQAGFGDITNTIAGQPFDGVVFVGFTEIGDLVNNLLNKNVTPQNHKMYGTEGFLLNTFAGQATSGRVERLAGFRGFVPYADDPFNGRLKGFRPGMQDLTYGAQAYDAVIAVALASAAARSDDPSQIARELPLVTRDGQKCASYRDCVSLLAQNPQADIDYDGVSGPLGFTSQGDICQGAYTLRAFDTTGYLSQILRQGFSSDQCT